MVKMHLCGITIEVPAKEVAWYKRAGYEVVIEPQPEPGPSEIQEDAPAVEKKAPGKRGKK